MSSSRRLSLFLKPKANRSLGHRAFRFVGGPSLLGSMLLVVGLTRADDESLPEHQPKPGAATKADPKGANDRAPQAEGTPVPPSDRGAPPVLREPSDEEKVQLDKDLSWWKDVEDDAPMRRPSDNDSDNDGYEGEHNAYNYALAHAHKQSSELLRRYAKEVPFANLIKPVRQDFLRDLIHIDGRLLQLDIAKPTKDLQKAEGIRNIYEGWVFPRDEDSPVCVQFTELPDDIKPGRKLDNVWVSFDGYYFKLIRYESRQHTNNGKYQWRRAPLLLGKSIARERPPVEEAGMTFGNTLIPAIVGIATAVVAAAVGITIWFRRVDRRVRHEVERAQYQNNPFQQPSHAQPRSGREDTESPPS